MNQTLLKTKRSRLFVTVAFSLIGLSLSCASFASNQLELNKKVDQLFRGVIGPNDPGCAVGIYRGNKILYSQGYGLANIENDVEITSESVFNIGSTSKQFTAASIIKLEQQGKLSLDDDIRQYLPEIPQYQKMITIRQLLHHTSGLKDYIDLLLLVGLDIDDVTTDSDALNIIKRQKSLNFEPGSEHLYSNTGYFLASLIVKRVSGKTLKDFAHDTLFNPLKMKSTSYINSHKSLVKNRATGYRKGEKGSYTRDVSYWEQNGDGGVFTTVEDLLHWDAVFNSESPENIRLKNALYQKGKLNSGKEISYALGLMYAEHKGLERIYHSGTWGGYRSNLARIPTHNLSVAVLCNNAHIHPVHMTEMTFQIYLSEHYITLEDKPVKTKEKLYKSVKINENIYQEISGKYEFLEFPNEFVELTYKDDVLTLIDYDETTTLFAASEKLLIDEQGKPRFEFKADETKGETVTMYGAKSSAPYPLKKWIPYVVSKSELELIAGNYRSDELNLDIQVEYIGENLIATDSTGRKFSLKFLDKDRLLTDSEYFNLLDVQRNVNGYLTSFSVSTQGSMNIVFLRE